MNPRKRVLAVDDEPHMRRLLEITLRQAGYQALIAANGLEALEILKNQGADIVVSDLHMPTMDGIGLLTSMRELEFDIPVIIVTAQGEIDSAVNAMKLGAADYILRPFDLETLEIAITRALALTRLKEENHYLREEIEGEKTLLGSSSAIQQVTDTIKKIASEKVTVLITGETGTGKEVVAKAIHANSNRKQGLFVAVNCAAIPHEMLESELFGHEKGAFTGAIKDRVGKFELAHEGTLFLDEITEMPISLQAKLLRALQENVIEKLGGNRPIAVDIRVIAATNRDPLQAVKDGMLREDLFYRLDVFRIDLPPLRNRPDDIPELCQHFLKKRGCQIDAEAIAALQSYAWPGNVRELENVIERASIVCVGNNIQCNDLPYEIQKPALAMTLITDADSAEILSIPQATATLEKAMIIKALEKTAGNKSKAAKILEISERSLWYKVAHYAIN
jgi:two-component system response regulator AtoC